MGSTNIFILILDIYSNNSIKLKKYVIDSMFEHRVGNN